MNARKMWALPGAELTAPASLLMHGGDATLLQLPCPSFLIEHPKGLVLFDTGCNAKIIDDAAGYWGQIAEALPIKWSKSDTLDKQIQGVGYKTSDVKYVILSHSHLDHSGGLTYFPKAKFLVGAGELRYAYWPDPDRRWAFILNDFLPACARWSRTSQIGRSHFRETRSICAPRSTRRRRCRSTSIRSRRRCRSSGS